MATLARPSAVHASWRAVAEVVVAALMLVLAVAADRAPTVFTDSDDYYELGRQIVGGVTDWLTPPPPRVLTADEIAEAAQAAEDRHMGHTQMASRSAAYALILYPLERAGTLWLVTLAQALAVAAMVRCLWRVAVPDAPPGHYLLGMAGLAAATPLPFFAGFAMPDIFAGIAVIGVAVLAVCWRALAPGLRWATWAVLALALAVHTSHLLLAVVLLPVATLVLWRAGALRDGRPALAAVAAALCAAWLFNAAYVRIDQLATGEALHRQPFLIARVLADGPGRTYLRRACATGTPYVLCRFAHEPLDDSEDILWSDRPANGVFLRSDYATRIALGAEETRFVAAVIADDPLGVVAAGLRNWGRQLAAYQVEEPVRDPHYYLTDDYWKDTFLPEMILGAADCGPARDGCAPRLTATLSAAWHGAWLALAGFAVAGLWWRRGSAASASERRLDALVVLLLAGVVLNAAVCGILSGPFARYGARVAWLVPLAAMLLASAAMPRRPGYSVSKAVKNPVTSA